MTKNIGLWGMATQGPTPIFKKMFKSQDVYILEHVKNGERVLDIGCGYGRNIQTLLKVTDKITGLDNDEQAIKETKQVMASNPGVKLFLADAALLPFAENSFDVVVLFDILQNLVENKVKTLQEVNRVLADDGKILISVYSEDALENRLKLYKKIGCPIVKIEGGKVIFDESVGANISEQFSREELDELAKKAGLKITDCKKIDSIAYLCELKKIK
jgi:ubiquinone/menaquinone biosynthesis C-methylase UbiE